MAKASLGSLIVSLGLDAAEFVSGLTKNEQLARKFGQQLERNIAGGIVKAEIAMRSLVAAAKVVGNTFQSLTIGAAAFKDLEETTGASAEGIASLAVAAATADVDINAVAGSLNKLTKNMVGVDDESKAAGAALKALNINIQDFKQLDPVAQYEAIGKALGDYADGAAKVAVAQALFGKSGAEQLKVFKALEEAGGRQTILTQQQIELSDAYNDQLAKSQKQLQLFAQAGASEAVSAFSDLTSVAVEFAKSLLGVDEATGKLVANNGAKEFAEAVVDAFALAADNVLTLSRVIEKNGKFLAAYAGVAKSLLSGELAQARAIGAEFRRDLDEIDNRFEFTKALARQRLISPDNQTAAETARLNRQAGIRPDPPKKQLKFAGAVTDLGAAQKKELDNQIRAIRAFADQQRDAFEFANQIVRGTYEDGLVDLRGFYAAQQQVRDAALQAQLSSIDKEISALRAARPKDDAERVDLEGKIAEAAQRRSEAVLKAGRDGALAAIEEARALKSLEERYLDFRANVLDLSGDTVGAANVRIAQQVADARRLLAQSGRGPQEADRFGELLRQTEQLNEAQREYGRLVDRARDLEEAALIAAQASGASELETMRVVGAIRRQSLQDLDQLVAKANELALALGTPEAIQFAERLGASFKRAAAEVDPLLLKIRDVGAEAARVLTDGLDAAIFSGQNLRDVLADVDKALAQIIVREVALKPFERWLGGVLGGNGSTNGGWIEAVGGFVSNFFGGGKAIGGGTMPNTMYRVAERKPEVFSDGSNQYLLTGGKRGNIDPNPRVGGGGRVINAPMTFNFPAGTDRRTASQVGAEVARQLAAVNSRMN